MEILKIDTKFGLFFSIHIRLKRGMISSFKGCVSGTEKSTELKILSYNSNFSEGLCTLWYSMYDYSHRTHPLAS